MAKYKRMINCDFVNASSFKIKVSNKAKLLYFFILTNADDKGFVDNVDELIEILDSNDLKFTDGDSIELFKTKHDAALKELIDKGYLYLFEDKYNNKIILIKHWYMHNQIPTSRVRDSSYEKYLKNIIIDDDKHYVIKPNAKQVSSKCHTTVKQVPSKCQADDKQLLTQNKLNKSKVNKIKEKETNIIEINNNLNNNEDEFDYKNIPERWDAFNTSKAIGLYTKVKKGEELDVNQELFLSAYLKSISKPTTENETVPQELDLFNDEPF